MLASAIVTFYSFSTRIVTKTQLPAEACPDPSTSRCSVPKTQALGWPFYRVNYKQTDYHKRDSTWYTINVLILLRTFYASIYRHYLSSPSSSSMASLQSTLKWSTKAVSVSVTFTWNHLFTFYAAWNRNLYSLHCYSYNDYRPIVT